MNLTQMIVELRAEREQIEQAILVRERIAAGQLIAAFFLRGSHHEDGFTHDLVGRGCEPQR